MCLFMHFSFLKERKLETESHLNSDFLFFFDWVIDFVSLFTERQVFLATWKDIPNENESQFQIKDCHLNSGNGGCHAALCGPCPAAFPLC